MTLVPITRMIDRVDRCRDDSDGVLYFELMLLGEMLAKLAIVGLVSGIGDEPNRLRYSAECKLVRADGLGSWCEVLNEVLTGPSTQFLHPKLYGVRKELIQGVDPSTWQYRAMAALNTCLQELDKSHPSLTNRVQGRTWFSLFTELRNKTKAHGAQAQGTLSALCPHLESALRSMMEGLSGVKHGVAPGIKRFLSFVAREAESNIESLNANTPIVESLARHYPEAWLMLSDIVLESGGEDALDRGKRYVSKFIESVASERQIEGWRRLVAISRRSGDVTAEAHALAQLCEFDEVPYNEISNAAHRLNTLSSTGLAASEKFEILGQLRKIMEERLDEATATDISRLAWLCLHLKDDYAAKSYTRLGLNTDPSNLYCQRLYDRLLS